MDSSHSAKPPLEISERDIVFTCDACTGELVVDRAGEGLTVPCPHCGNALVIPAYQSSASPPTPPEARTSEPSSPLPPSPARHFDFAGQTPDQIERRSGDLQRQLKENRSQDTEMRGHVNRATMELHRFQLKLKKLQERQADIEAELTAIQSYLRQDGA